MDIHRTPHERFADLHDFPFAQHEVTIEVVADTPADGLRVAYVADGPADGSPVVMLHGEPTWSYLYRSMIPVLAAAGHRVVAPDMVGFGRSDKPGAVADHTYGRHVSWMRAFLDALDLDGITWVGQDWGGLIGLRLLADQPDRFARFVAANTGLPTGDHAMPDIWHAFRATVNSAEQLDVARLVQHGTQRTLATDELAAYDAPFPDERDKAGPRAMPELVPYHREHPAAEDNRHAWRQLADVHVPLLTAFSDGDPITRGFDHVLQRHVPGASGQPHATIAGAGHFLQEDRGVELAETIAAFMSTS